VFNSIHREAGRFSPGRKAIWATLALLFSFISLGFESTSNTNMKTTIRPVEYRGWRNNLQISNGTVELVMTLDVGPRIIRFGYIGGQNVFKEYEEQMGKSGEDSWQIRGGHRLWHAPEDARRTYALDNTSIKYEKLSESSVRLIQPVESMTGIQKEIDVKLENAGTGVTLTHRLRNANLWDVELAPWALSVMSPGGTAIIPLPQKISHPGSLEPGEKPDYRGFVPNMNLVMWPFTDLSDPRWRWGAQYITLKQDASAKKPTKLGMTHKMAWVAYLNQGVLFVKSIDYREGRQYTDGGSNFETFTNKDMLEIESLGSFEKIAPGKFVEHIERWWLLKGIPNETSDAAINANIRLNVETLMK
jgi:hypothetical protein